MSITDLLNQPWGAVQRHTSHSVQIGKLSLGAGQPIVIQSMTNTDTSDVPASVEQVLELAEAGSEMVRLTVNTREAAQAIPRIKEQLLERGCDVPLIGDFHFNGHQLLTQVPECAAALDKYRINPGNVGGERRRDENFEAIVAVALKYAKPVRIGVNWGSLDRQVLAEAMDVNSRRTAARPAREVMIAAVVQSALQSAQLAEKCGLTPHQIILSAKMSSVQDVIAAYQLLALNCRYALHVGLTEAGLGNQGIVASAAAIACLLQAGLGDTIRVSLTPRPGGRRSEEVEICQLILQALNLRKFRPSITSCPGCGRTTSTLFQQMAQDMEDYFRDMLPVWRKEGLRGVEDLHIAVMGCVVNGPGESRNANIGISLPGDGEEPRAPVYVDGKLATILQGPAMMGEFKRIVTEYVQKNYRLP